MLVALADEDEYRPDLAEWHALQSWLQTAEHRVTIPYATELAELVPPVAVRLRRDFGALSPSSAATPSSTNRPVTATTPVGSSPPSMTTPWSATSSATSSPKASAPPSRPLSARPSTPSLRSPREGVTAARIAEKLSLDKSTTCRRLRVAADGGWIVNLEDERGAPGRWVIGDPMPEETDILPQPRNLTGYETPGQGDGCKVASVLEEKREDP